MKTQVSEKAKALQENTVLLSFEMHSMGNRRKVASSQANTGADPDMVKVSKQLLKAPELEAIQRHGREMRKFVLNYTLPSWFKEGCYLVDTDAVDKIEEELDRRYQMLEPLVKDLERALDERVEEAQRKLGPLFDPNDYPKPEQLQYLFSWDWKWVQLETPRKLNTISSVIYKKEVAKAQRSLEEAVAEVTAVLRDEFKEVVDHLCDKLTPDKKTGKKKIFREASVRNVKDFLERFEFRNVTDDEDLAKLVGRCKKLLNGTTGEALRTNDGYRETVQKRMKRLSNDLEKVVVDRPVRKISFDD